MAPPDAGLWDWACDFYSLPRVAALLLELQDRHGQSIPYLLWRLWRIDRAAPPETLARAAAAARTWEAGVIGPLRAARRALRDLGDSPGGSTLRVQVAELERRAERRLLETLATLPWPSSGSAPETPLAGLPHAVDVFGGAIGDEAVARLLELSVVAVGHGRPVC